MTVLWMDGFSHYKAAASATAASSYMTGAYAVISNTTSLGIDTMPVLGGSGLYLTATTTSTNAIPLLSWALPSAMSTGIIGAGFHFYLTALPTGVSNTTGGFFGFGATNAIRYLVQMTTGGQLYLMNSSGTNLANSGANVMSAGTLYHIEAQLNIASSGSFELRVNGQTWITYSGTTNGSSVSAVNWDQSRLTGNTNVYPTFFIDNVYIYNNSGSINNNWLGERTVYTILPNADTAEADWTLSTGSNGYDLLNDVPAAPSTNYIQSTGVGDRSVFDMASLSTSSISPIAIQTVIQGQKTTSGTVSLKIGPQTNSVEDLSGDLPMTQSQSLYFSYVSENNPDTSAPWTPTQINAVKVVIERSA